VLSFLRPRHHGPPLNALTTDLHSHLLAGLDDGVESHEQALAIIRIFQEQGYKKIITTPHIIQDIYRNTPALIREALVDLQAFLESQHVTFEIEAAAEYYLDEEMARRIDQKEELMTFGDQYLLFETNMITEPYFLKDVIFKLTSSGIKPILAHPERYAYMSIEKAEDLKDRGVLFQLNALSLIGYYSPVVQNMAKKLIDKGWINLIGSDCHHIEQARLLESVRRTKYFQKALALPLLNNSL
jgi:tyrosine-protein phosphatase YwqE